jgi:thymidylate synthase
MATEYKLNLIFNRSIQGIIGVNNSLFTGINEDFGHFKEQTTNKIVVMGYNTFISLPGKKDINLLSDRLNVVISNYHYDILVEKIKKSQEKLDVVVFRTFDDFYNGLVENTIVFENDDYMDVKDIFIIGGSYLYNYVYDNYKINLICETISDVRISIDDYTRERNKIIYFNRLIDDKKYLKIYSKESSGIISVNMGKTLHNPEGGFKKITGKYNINIYQARNDVNFQELEYLNLLKLIYEEGIHKDSRNSKVTSIFSPPQMRYDLRKGFPLLTTKRVPWKTVLRELLWFISGSTDNKVLQDKKVRIWDGNSTREYLESRGLGDYREGDLGPIYGFQWRHFGAEYKGADHDYTGDEEGGIDQLKYVIDLIERDPGSRRIIINSWNANDLDKMALPPCHVMVQFSVDTREGCIDAKLTQRSGDMFLGVPFNIASYAFLLHIICNITGYKPRYFIHDIGDAHIYDNHKEAIIKQIKRPTYEFPQLEINRQLNNIDDIHENDFNIKDYKHQGTIKAEMVA